MHVRLPLQLLAPLFLLALGCGASTGLNVPDQDAGEEADAVDTSLCEPERCNGLDDDCDGVADDGLFCFFLDGDPIEAAARGACGPDWYSYGSPDPESANPSPDIRVSDEVVVGLQAGSCGAYVAVIADLPNDGSMGALNGSFQMSEGTLDGVAVGDEPDECRFDEARGRVACEWVWQNCCTDGVLLGPFRDDFCMVVNLNEERGVTRLSALDGPTRQRDLALGRAFEICGRLVPER